MLREDTKRSAALVAEVLLRKDRAEVCEPDWREHPTRTVVCCTPVLHHSDWNDPPTALFRAGEHTGGDSSRCGRHGRQESPSHRRTRLDKPADKPASWRASPFRSWISHPRTMADDPSASAPRSLRTMTNVSHLGLRNTIHPEFVALIFHYPNIPVIIQKLISHA